MKKIFSLVLVCIMIASMIPTALAVEAGGNWNDGTMVSYVGKGQEAYEVVVPATMAPGGSAIVSVSGTWASNRKLVVATKTDSVVLTNNIKASDTKTLKINFSGIELVGDNTKGISDSADISIDHIADVLFGTWEGEFEYTVEMQDVTQ